MTKRLLSIILSVLLVLTMIPSMAFASAGGTLTLSGVDVAAANTDTSGKIMDGTTQVGTVQVEQIKDGKTEYAKLTKSTSNATLAMDTDYTYNLVVTYNSAAKPNHVLKVKNGGAEVATGTSFAKISLANGTDATYSFETVSQVGQFDVVPTGSSSDANQLLYSGGDVYFQKYTVATTAVAASTVNLGKMEVYKNINGTWVKQSLTRKSGETGNTLVTLDFLKENDGSGQYKLLLTGIEGQLSALTGFAYDSSLGGYAKAYTETELDAVTGLAPVWKTGTVLEITGLTAETTTVGTISTNHTISLLVKGTDSTWSTVTGTTGTDKITYTIDKAKDYKVSITTPQTTKKMLVVWNGQTQVWDNEITSGTNYVFEKEIKGSAINGIFNVTASEVPGAGIEYTQPVGKKVFDIINLSAYVPGDNAYTFRYTEVADIKGTAITSGNEKVSKVNANGDLKLKKTGTAYIKIEAMKNGVVDKTGYATFTIDKATQKINVTTLFTGKKKGDVFNLGAKALGGVDLTYSATGGVSVDRNGNVTVNSLSSGKILVAAASNEYYTADTKEVTVTPSAAGISGSISLTGIAKVGYSLSVDTSKVTPSDARYNLEYKWYRSGTSTPISYSSSYYITSADVDKTITVYVTGKNGYTGSLSTSKFVDNGKPVISSQPQTAKYFKGDTISTLRVTATSSSSSLMRYQWYKNNVAITGATSSYYTPVRTEYGGDAYKCRVTNSEGYTDTAVANVVLVREVGKIKHGKMSRTDDAARIRWSKASNAHRYEVFMATSPNGEYKRIKIVKGTTYRKGGLKSNTKYYFKVRAYRNDKINGVTYKTYGDLSSRKTVKTAK